MKNNTINYDIIEHLHWNWT